MKSLAALIVFFLVLILVGPILTIWSLNTLFGLDIAYTVWTWLAVVWLSTVTFGGVMNSVRSRD